LLDRQSIVIALLLSLVAGTASALNHRRAHSITLFDQNGRVALSAPKSPTGATVNVDVGNGGNNFSPATVNIVVGDTVKWTWVGSFHNVRSGAPCSGVDNAFCSPNDTSCASNGTSNAGATYSHTFNQAGTFQYYCSIHCNSSNMKGSVVVSTPFIMITSITYSGGSVTILGQTLPNLTIHIETSPDLVSGFTNPVAVIANPTGGFSYVDSTALPMRFYHAVYP
jgi:plastocyanin